jgi:gamma-polyglutamate biosynthesis protein CapC
VVEIAIGLGLTLSLIVSELFGVASAGLVVPGYLALYLDQPGRVAATILVAMSTWGTVRFGFDRLVVLYGRRRFGITILTGFLLNAALDRAQFFLPPEAAGLRAIGYIVPGLIASTALAQGVWATLGMTFLVAGLVRAVLMVLAHV